LFGDIVGPDVETVLGSDVSVVVGSWVGVSSMNPSSEGGNEGVVCVGKMLGFEVGGGVGEFAVGSRVGLLVVIPETVFEGELVGFPVGRLVEGTVGLDEGKDTAGFLDGIPFVARVGTLLGTAGFAVGLGEGPLVADGLEVGAHVGFDCGLQEGSA